LETKKTAPVSSGGGKGFCPCETLGAFEIEKGRFQLQSRRGLSREPTRGEGVARTSFLIKNETPSKRKKKRRENLKRTAGKSPTNKAAACPKPLGRRGNESSSGKREETPFGKRDSRALKARGGYPNMKSGEWGLITGKRRDDDHGVGQEKTTGKVGTCFLKREKGAPLFDTQEGTGRLHEEKLGGRPIAEKKEGNIFLKRTHK